MDSRKIDELSGFATFLEFLKNPQPVEDKIRELKSAVAEWREANEKARGIKDVEKWRAAIQKELDDRKTALDAQDEAHKKRKKAFEEMVEKKTNALDAEQTRLNEVLASIEQKSSELNALLSQKPEMDLREQRIADREEEVALKEAEVRDRLARLARAMEA